MASKKHKSQTLEVHGKIEGRKREGETVFPAVYSSAFEHEKAQDLADVFKQRKFGHIYSRISNPTVAKFEEKFNLLEDGIGALAVSSGMSAIAVALLAILKTGDEFVTGNSLFGGTWALFESVFCRFGIKPVFVESADLAAYEKAIGPKCKAVFLETIGNPKLDVPDIQAIAEIAHKNNAPLLIDNTAATPALLSVKDLGADFATHSASKYINGNGNSIGGILVDLGTFTFEGEKYEDFELFRKKFGPMAFLAKARKQIFMNLGPCLAPQNAFNFSLGLETLSLRMPKHCSNALALASFLQKHPKVLKVNYPGLEGCIGYEVAQKQFKQGMNGGLVTMELKDQNACWEFINARGFARHLSNIGDAKTLILHPASTIYTDYSEEDKETMGVNDRLIRISVGLEDEQDLIEEFDQALAAA